MSSLQEITYSSRTEIASESGSGALAAIYRRAIERYEEKQKGGPEAVSDDGTKSTEDFADAVCK